MEGENFYNLFCNKFGCAPAEFQKTVLWQCVNPTAMPLCRLIWRVRRSFFHEDIELIEEVKHLTTYASVRDAIVFSSVPQQNMHFLRRYFKVRMSKGKLMALARELLNK